MKLSPSAGLVAITRKIPDYAFRQSDLSVSLKEKGERLFYRQFARNIFFADVVLAD